MLVLSVGVTEAARQTGIDLSTVKQWSARGKWLAHTREERQLPASMQPITVTGVTKPADALAEILSERRTQTKLHQSKYVMRASEVLADVPDEKLLVVADTGKILADMASKVWPEQAIQVGVAINLGRGGME